MLDVDDRWTGRTAAVLQDAFRMSNDAFANHLGVAVRTVAAWHQLPARIPNTETQAILSTALDRAPPPVRERFAGAIIKTTAPTSFDSHALTVAIAVVRRDDQVLLVNRRGNDGKDDSWQFPAGMIKPGYTPSTVAVRETLGETGVHCIAVESLGRRIHPASHVLCEYVLCEYLSGDAENRDPGENVSVSWAALDRLHLFIPPDRIFTPVRQALQLEDL